MVSLILLVFILHLAIYLLGTVEGSAINQLLWILWNKLPTSTSDDVRQNNTLRKDVLRLRRELNGVSAQDQFSKWAKLDRQHNKAKAEYEKKDASLRSSKAKFDAIATSARWLSTNGSKIFLQFWYSRVALFWIPEGWLPGYAEWILAFPRAPRGSVGIQIWSFACASVIAMVGEAASATYLLASGKAANQEKAQSGEANPDAAEKSEKNEL